MRKPIGLGWKGIAGTLTGAAASFLAIYLLKSARGRNGTAPAYPQSGQAPSRTHIRLSSHPAALAR